MMEENQNINFEDSPKEDAQENSSPPPPDSDLFAGKVLEELSEHSIFAGDEDFFKSLASCSPADTTRKPANTGLPLTGLIRNKRLSIVQKGLAVIIVVIAAVLIYALLKSPSATTANTQPLSATQQTPHPAGPAKVSLLQIPESQSASKTTTSSSLEVAQTLYLKGDYSKALPVYEQLYKSISAMPSEDLMGDFLQLRIALCLERTADYEQANRLYRTLANSRSDVIKVIANYRRGLLEMQKKQYLNARAKAYQSIALIDMAAFDKDSALLLKKDCYFLAAEAVTKKVFSLCDVDNNFPEDIWSNFSRVGDPLANLNETELRACLSSCSQQLGRAILGPRIEQLNHKSIPQRYSVICNGASIEELLSRLAANTGFDVHWVPGSDGIGIRKRAINLYLPSSTTQQAITIASGCSGLLARLDKKGIIDIFNPTEISYASEQISLLSGEAVSLWQQFLLRFPNDSRHANVHFALGLLQSKRQHLGESLAEYKLLANQFSISPLAPFALLNSSKLKTSIRNYPGALQDLKQLVEQYPDTEIAEQAYLYLADTTAKAGVKAETAQLYRKVYHLSLSTESRSAAALGAGKAFYQIKDYESAAKWLFRYIDIAKNHKSKGLSSAYFLLGKTNLALGKPEVACLAFQYVIQMGSSLLAREEYIETVSALVEGYTQQGHFARAFDLLERIHSEPLSQKESAEILLLKCRLLRAIGLVDKAISILSDRVEYISDPQLKNKVSFELADCYVNNGNMELARKKLTEILGIPEHGPLACQAALKLANVCLKLGENDQAISVSSQLLDMEPSEEIKREALSVLATSYERQKNHNRAALALLGQWK